MINNPFRWGFIAALGVILALVLGAAFGSLGTVLTYIVVALFLALGLDPVVDWLTRHRFSRGLAIGTVAMAAVVILVLILMLIVPLIVKQSITLVSNLPSSLNELETQEWFIATNDALGGALVAVTDWLGTVLVDPNFWLYVTGGALKAGIGVVNGVVSLIFIYILTLYFLGSLDAMKNALYSLIAASRRAGVVSMTEQIADSVGKYLVGQGALALSNAIFSTLLLWAAGVPSALVLGVLAFFVTLIPMVGTVIMTAIMTTVALFHSLTSAIIVLLGMLVYMQVEAYILTPKVMSKAVEVPGALVLIGAMVGATLGGLVGALIAVPVTAALLMILKQVVVPRQALQ